MARDIYINGETLVLVKGGSHRSGGPISRLSELGLSVGPIRITPQFNYGLIKAVDYGPVTPAEIQCQLAHVDIEMTLVHYDPTVLDVCWAESMGGAYNYVGPLPAQGPIINAQSIAGKTIGAGSTLGHGLPVLASGNHFISVNLTAPQRASGQEWHFKTCYLNTPPLVYPLGTERSLVQCQFRAIPYSPIYQFNSGVSTGQPGVLNIQGFAYTATEVRSSGVVIWDNQLDTEGEVRVPLM